MQRTRSSALPNAVRSVDRARHRTDTPRRARPRRGAPAPGGAHALASGTARDERAGAPLDRARRAARPRPPASPPRAPETAAAEHERETRRRARSPMVEGRSTARGLVPPPSLPPRPTRRNAAGVLVCRSPEAGSISLVCSRPGAGEGSVSVCSRRRGAVGFVGFARPPSLVVLGSPWATCMGSSARWRIPGTSARVGRRAARIASLGPVPTGQSHGVAQGEPKPRLRAGGRANPGHSAPRADERDAPSSRKPRGEYADARSAAPSRGGAAGTKDETSHALLPLARWRARPKLPAQAAPGDRPRAAEQHRSPHCAPHAGRLARTLTSARARLASSGAAVSCCAVEAKRWSTDQRRGSRRQHLALGRRRADRRCIRSAGRSPRRGVR